MDDNYQKPLPDSEHVINMLEFAIEHGEDETIVPVLELAIWRIRTLQTVVDAFTAAIQKSVTKDND